MVDLGQRETVDAFDDHVQVIDRVKDGNHVEEASEEANAHLSQDGLGDVPARSEYVNGYRIPGRGMEGRDHLLRNFFRQMGGTIRVPNTVCTIQHASNKNESLALVSSPVLPGTPDEIVGRIRLVVDVRHGGTDDDGDEDTGQNKEHADVADMGKNAVHEKNDKTANPRADDEAHEDLPVLWYEAGVHERVHRDGLLAQNRCDRRSAQNPRQTVPPSGKEATGTTIFPGGDGSPVVDTTC